MPYETIESGLTVLWPTKGTTNWSDTLKANLAQKVSEHDHAGDGKGLQIGSSAIANLAVTTGKIADGAVTAAKLDGGVGQILPGSVISGLWASAPSGYLAMIGRTIGDAVSGGVERANADCEDLFTVLWDNLADAEAPVSGGRGASAAADWAAHKTITIPDIRQKFPIAKSAAGVGATLGAAGGNLNHTHTGPSHTHTGPSHTHSGPSHTHTIPAHYHGMGTGADLNITSSGSHNHNINYGANGAGPTIASYGGFLSGAPGVFPSSSKTHTHAVSDFDGRVGLVTGGVNGNATMTSGADGIGSTGTSGTGATGAGGTGATGNNTEQPPYFTLNFYIKL